MKFRPGASRERFCLGTVVTVVDAATCAPVPNRAIGGARHRYAIEPRRGGGVERRVGTLGG
jgi:hypothetical protein